MTLLASDDREEWVFVVDSVTQQIRGGGDQGSGVGVETGVGVGQSQPFWLESDRLWPTPTPAQSRRLTPSDRIDFGWTILHTPEKIEWAKEKEIGSV